MLLLGVAYKKDIDDVRESPALSIIDRLRAQGRGGALPRSVCEGGPSLMMRTPEGGGEPHRAPMPLTDEELRAQ